MWAAEPLATSIWTGLATTLPCTRSANSTFWGGSGHSPSAVQYSAAVFFHSVVAIIIFYTVVFRCIRVRAADNNINRLIRKVGLPTVSETWGSGGGVLTYWKPLSPWQEIWIYAWPEHLQQQIHITSLESYKKFFVSVTIKLCNFC